MNDKSGMSVPLAAELYHAFIREGWEPSDVKKLCKHGVLAQILPAMRGGGEKITVSHTIDCSVLPEIPKGWKIFLHKRYPDVVWSLDRIEFLPHPERDVVPFLSYPRNMEIVERVEKLPFANANILDYLLRNKHIIPEGWKVYGVPIAFWGTIYDDSHGDRCLRSLHWNGRDWEDEALWLDQKYEGHKVALLAA